MFSFIPLPYLGPSMTKTGCFYIDPIPRLSRGPRKIRFLLNLNGVDLSRQSFFLNLILLLNVAAMIASLIVSLSIHQSAFFTANEILMPAISIAMRIIILVKRTAVRRIIKEATRNLSSASLKKLKRFELIVCSIISIFAIQTLLSSIQFYSDSNLTKPGLFLGLYEVNIVLLWILNCLQSVFYAISEQTYFIFLSFYAWVYMSLHLFKSEMSSHLVPSNRRLLMIGLLEMDRKHELFESAFSLLLLSISSYTFCAAVYYLFGMILMDGKGAYYIIYLTYIVVTRVSAFAFLICLICRCQDDLARGSVHIYDNLCAEEVTSGGPSPVLLVRKIEKVHLRRVTIWRTLDVTRSLILATCSSLLTFSVLIIQIDNGSLKQPTVEPAPR